MRFLDAKGLELVLSKIKEKIESMENSINSSLSNYLTKKEASETYYNKEKTNELYQRKGSYVVSNDLKSYYTKTETDSKIDKAVFGSGKLNNYYTKEEAESTFLKKTETPNLTGYLTKSVADGYYQPKGAYLTQNDVFDTSTIKLPNGAKIGVE